jgi:hypothetical protein
MNGENITIIVAIFILFALTILQFLKDGYL